MPALITQAVTDISSADQLLRYAAAGQLLPLEENGYTHERIAVGAGLGSSIYRVRCIYEPLTRSVRSGRAR
jgi:hypothetical protein